MPRTLRASKTHVTRLVCRRRHLPLAARRRLAETLGHLLRVVSTRLWHGMAPMSGLVAAAEATPVMAPGGLVGGPVRRRALRRLRLRRRHRGAGRARPRGAKVGILLRASAFGAGRWRTAHQILGSPLPRGDGGSSPGWRRHLLYRPLLLKGEETSGQRIRLGRKVGGPHPVQLHRPLRVQ